MSTLTTMKFDDSRTMHEHVIEMTNIAAKLKILGMDVDENFLVQFVLNSLPSEYGPFQMNYNTMKDNWNIHELHSMLVQEETRMRSQLNYSINYVNHQGARKKVKVPYNTLWIDSGCTAHVSNTKQRFITTRTTRANENFVFMGNRVKVPVEAVGTYRLIIDN
ncbi:hypothetical protein Lal_00021037 [Lupinus albus]|nr:hypothetical protein Lal_00021037 [Lupinus albus]